MRRGQPRPPGAERGPGANFGRLAVVNVIAARQDILLIMDEYSSLGAGGVTGGARTAAPEQLDDDGPGVRAGALAVWPGAVTCPVVQPGASG